MQLKKILWVFPKGSRNGQKIPKIKIYEKRQVNHKTREAFISEIEKIDWAYKLSEETTNLTKNKLVPEIEILSLYLKGDSVSDSVIQTIDKAIPFPIIFELHRYHTKPESHEVCYIASHTTPYTVEEGPTLKWRFSDYINSDWVNVTESIHNGLAKELPIVSSLQGLYESLLAQLVPIKKIEHETLEQTFFRLAEIKKLEQKLSKLNSQKKKEKQFNRRVAINEKIKELQVQIKQLSDL